MLPLLDEEIDLVQNHFRSQIRWKVVLAHENVRDQLFAKLVSSFCVDHERLVPVIASGDQAVCDVEDNKISLGPLAAIVDKEAL